MMEVKDCGGFYASLLTLRECHIYCLWRQSTQTAAISCQPPRPLGSTPGARAGKGSAPLLITTTPELEQRMRQVRVLLDTRHDYLPSVHVTDLGDRPGPAASKRVPCELCDRSGRYRVRAGSRVCPACGGSGWRRRRPEDEEWDEYTETLLADAQLGVAGLPSVGEDIQRLTASIDRIQADLDARAGLFDQEQYGWEKARRSYYRHGSYAELDRSLTIMARGFPYLHSVLVQATARALPARPARNGKTVVAMGEAYLATEMRGPIRVPKWISYERSVSKTPTVKQLAMEGMKSPQIAKRLGLSKSKVKFMLRRIDLA